MKRPPFLYAALAALLILSATAPGASAALVTYFNFNDSDEISDSPGVQVSTITQNALTPSFVTGTTLNGVSGETAGMALRLSNQNNGNGNPKTFQFSVNTTALQNLSLSYATQASVSGFTQTLSYSINGGTTFVVVGTFIPTTTGFTQASFDLSGTTAINNQANVIFQIALTQNGGLKGDFNDFDNIQLTATALIPEPATVTGGVLALVALGYIERRRLRAAFRSTRKKTSQGKS